MANYVISDKPKTTMFNHLQNHHRLLIPTLPDDLALECLLRVPITFHPNLRLVSHGWKSAMADPSFYTERRRLGLAEDLVCLIQPISPLPQPPETVKHHLSPAAEIGGPPQYNLNIYNLTRREWRRVSLSVPTFAQCVAVPAEKKVVVLGGWDPSTLEPVNKVLVVDLVTGTWKEGSPMPTARSFFSTMAVGPTATVYVAGGHDGQKNALRSAEAYDVAADYWWTLPEMSEERDESQGFSFDGSKFWVVSGYGTESQGRFRSDVEVFDPEVGSWSKIEGWWPFPTTTPKTTTAVAGGRWRRWLFVGEGELREFDWEENRWKGLNSNRVPKPLNGSNSVSLVDVGEKIFAMGNCDGEGECMEGCGGEGAFILENKIEDVKLKDDKWKHVHTPPCTFLGLPFSTSHLLV